MRRVLASAGRRKRAAKRGGDLPPVPVSDIARETDPLLNVVAVDIAMNRLEKLSPEATRVWN